MSVAWSGDRPRVCVVGAGGREHALAAVLARTAEVMVAPGNAGMDALADGAFSCTAAAPEDIDADLWVVGPEQPLVGGMADRLRSRGRLVLGPGAAGAQLEGSKAWMKDLLVEAGVPTAAHGSFTELGPAVEYLRSLPPPWVVKTDGLASGKGVLVTDDLDRAVADVAAKLSGSFGAAGTRVVVEEGMVGAEVSVMAICDGRRALPLLGARDYKRAGDGDTGPNTGGMGAVAPAPGAGAEVVEVVMAEAVAPTLAALADRGIDYRGVLYAGVMLTAAGPRILEFNIRFGDPETQAVLPLCGGDLTAVLAAAAAGRLDVAPPLQWSAGSAVTVVMAADGYPGAVRGGDAVTGLAEAAATEGAWVFAAGLGPAARAGGHSGGGGTRGLVTAGGRVVAVTGTGADTAEARRVAYAAADRIRWQGRTLRHDIAAAPPVSGATTAPTAPTAPVHPDLSPPLQEHSQ